VAGFFFYAGAFGALSILSSWYVRRLARKGTLYPEGVRALVWLIAHLLPWFAAFVPAVVATRIYRLSGGVSWVYLGVTLTGLFLLVTAPRLPTQKPVVVADTASEPTPLPARPRAQTASRRPATAEP
jgi:hypothetical protein